HEDIELRDDAMDQLLRLRALQVEHEAALASIEHVVGLALAGGEAADAPDALTLGWFDLDDVRAEVREVHAAIGPRHALRNLEYLHSCQRSRHRPSPLLVGPFDSGHITPVLHDSFPGPRDSQPDAR